ncbi:MAG TPA: exopolysaccharide biosynthesis polyprenyl glycosylphosphotransferase [Armatimonadetes bacterium]|jgi:exopolysaccharide biosynthesis polyprenyl glycosylphosphotransferase|nr:exopolysaccharide biosynthesis polyprenyl glycosylphosphotransferase [Armatimonadota bacterium]
MVERPGPGEGDERILRYYEARNVRLWGLRRRLVLRTIFFAWGLSHASRSVLKRVLDLVLGLSAVIVSLPVMLLTALAIKLDSPGPVLFVQTRVGRWGEAFPLLKFRSMYVDAEARRAELEACNEASGPVFKIRNDPRITRVGRIIRKLSIDELPQLFNVIAGHMSLVGPRPPLPSEVAQYTPEHRRRLDVKPGITCIWQVSGRSNVDFERWVMMDVQYIEEESLWLDIRLLLRTIPAVLFGRGAY